MYPFQTVLDIPSVVINLYNPAYISSNGLEFHLYCTILRDEHCSPIPSFPAQKTALNKPEFYSRDKKNCCSCIWAWIFFSSLWHKLYFSSVWQKIENLLHLVTWELVSGWVISDFKVACEMLYLLGENSPKGSTFVIIILFSSNTLPFYANLFHQQVFLSKFRLLTLLLCFMFCRLYRDVHMCNVTDAVGNMHPI